MSDDRRTDDPDEPRTLDLVVPGSLDGYRLDRALSLLADLSRSQAHDLIGSGAVRLNGAVVTKVSHKLLTSQHLEVELPDPPTDQVDADATVDVNVVIDDEDFVVVNKAPGVVVHPGAGHASGTLVAGLLARFPELSALVASGDCEPFRPGIVHRLDKGTSGLLVVAKTSRGLGSLRGQLARRTMHRTYLGLVEGHVEAPRGVVDAPLGRSLSSPTLMAVRADGRNARTHYEVLERIERPHHATLLRLQLETGRTHQIRVHMASIGHPIVNDLRYGHRRDQRLDVERFFLHASALDFVHPASGLDVHVEAPLPSDLRSLVPNVED